MAVREASIDSDASTEEVDEDEVFDEGDVTPLDERNDSLAPVRLQDLVDAGVARAQSRAAKERRVRIGTVMLGSFAAGALVAVGVQGLLRPAEDGASRACVDTDVTTAVHAALVKPAPLAATTRRDAPLRAIVDSVDGALATSAWGRSVGEPVAVREKKAKKRRRASRSRRRGARPPAASFPE